MLMRGQMLIEGLLVLTLLPLLLYIALPPKLLSFRQSMEFAQDIAQLYLYLNSTQEIEKLCKQANFYCRIGEEELNTCEARFVYCTKRYLPISLEEVQICAGVCS